MQLSRLGQTPIDRVERRPLADNDDEPFDPPPARALRAPHVPEPVVIVASSVARPVLRAA
jgi:hypothetical protein